MLTHKPYPALYPLQKYYFDPNLTEIDVWQPLTLINAEQLSRRCLTYHNFNVQPNPIWRCEKLTKLNVRVRYKAWVTILVEPQPNLFSFNRYPTLGKLGGSKLGELPALIVAQYHRQPQEVEGTQCLFLSLSPLTV